MNGDMFSKMCSSCGIQPAMLFFRIFDGTTIGEQGLCPSCALGKFSEGKGLDLKVANSEILHTINEMCNILSDIAAHITSMCENNNNKLSHTHNQTCQWCGYLLSDFVDSGMLGCSFCYTEFHEDIYKELAECNFAKIHKGTIPSRYRKLHLVQMELEKLKIRLSALVNQELYEEAAKISKRIAKLESRSIDIFL